MSLITGSALPPAVEQLVTPGSLSPTVEYIFAAEPFRFPNLLQDEVRAALDAILRLTMPLTAFDDKPNEVASGLGTLGHQQIAEQLAGSLATPPFGFEYYPPNPSRRLRTLPPADAIAAKPLGPLELAWVRAHLTREDLVFTLADVVTDPVAFLMVAALVGLNRPLAPPMLTAPGFQLDGTGVLISLLSNLIWAAYVRRRDS